MSTTPIDRAERERALATDTSFIVEAPAGSGKTGLLIQRYLRLLAQSNVTDPAQVLAITFTIKATEEIRSRVLDALRQAETEAEPDDEFARALFQLAREVRAKDVELGWHLVDQPSRMNIRTIDSLASQIARALPLLSGGLGALGPVDDAGPLYRRAARRVMAQMGGDDKALDEALRAVLLHRDADLRNLEDLLAEMLSKRDQWARMIPMEAETSTEEYLETVIRPQMDQALAQEICGRLQLVEKLIPDDLKRRLADVAALLCKEPGYNGEDNFLAGHCKAMDTLPGTECGHLPAWLAVTRMLVNDSGGWRKHPYQPRYLKLDLSKFAKGELKSLIEDLQRDDLLSAMESLRSAPPYPYPADQWAVVKALFLILRNALAQLQIAFAESGSCDFPEVSLSARRALQHGDGSRDLASVLGTRLQHLLMDEMQDTSASQYELLQLLTSGWDGATQTVFLVGDPKQSIYLFREARVELFLRALQDKRLGSIPLERIALRSNFRSQARLVDDFNETFEQVFSGGGSAIEYIGAQASVAATEHSLQWKLMRTPYLSKDATMQQRIGVKRAQREWETGGIVAEIEAWRAAHPAGKIAVLVRSKKHAAGVLAKLGKADIPARAVEMDELSERMEVLDLFALTRALLHAGDRTAWLAVLHAPWCGLGMADLHRLVAGDDASLRKRAILPLAEAGLEKLSAEPRKRAARTLETMRAAMAQQGQVPLPQWVERTWRTLGGDAYLDPEQRRNADRYLALLERLNAEGVPPSIAEIERRMEKLFAESDASAPVEVLTMHKAKGLEWDLVLVPAMERTGQNDRTPLLNWAEVPASDGGPASILLAPIQSKGEDATKLNKYLDGMRRAQSHAELSRLFYVAATRARTSLHLYATLKELKSGDVNPKPGTLLHSAWDVVGPHFETSAAERPTVLDADPSAREFIGDIAATASPALRKATLQRLPIAFDPVARFVSQRSALLPVARRASGLARPEGSLIARALGDTAHVFMEALAKVPAGELDTLRSQLPSWRPRILAYARTHGLDQRQAGEIAKETIKALDVTLGSETGRWLLGAHPAAESERVLRVTGSGGEVSFLRIDRTFLAGEMPQSRGTTHRWIVDFKTNAFEGDREVFLDRERSKYGPQMDAYARAWQQQSGMAEPVMLALFYPLLDRILYWAAS